MKPIPSLPDSQAETLMLAGLKGHEWIPPRRDLSVADFADSDIAMLVRKDRKIILVNAAAMRIGIFPGALPEQ